MVQESSIVERDFVFLVQTKNQSLERRLSNAIKEENVRLKSVKSFADLKEQQPEGSIITFVIGSDVEDPIQSAQRLHAFKESAKIILLSKSEKNAENLREAIRFSPFIGTEVFCLTESKEQQLEKKLNEILKNSLQAEKYRDIIAESNFQVSLQASSKRAAFNPNFINKLMDIAPVGIAIVDQDGKVLGWNKEATLIFERNEAQTIGIPFFHLFGLPEGNKLENFFRQSFEKEKPGSIEPLILEREVKDTPKQVLSLTAAPFTYSEGAEKALILAIKDITQNVELLDRLKTAVIARDNFLSMASHELRTPLTTIRINLELLKAAVKQDFPNASGFLRLNDKSLKETNRLNNLIENLFDIAKIHSGKLDFKLEEFNLSEFVKSYVTGKEEKFKKANCELEMDIDPNVVGVWDKDRIGQALANLITNALKYAPNAPVRIILKTAGTWACLSVQDQGPGIPEDKQEKIFDRFERATDSKTISGLGLGLYITKKIVEGHAGKIEIQSDPGKGSTFTMKLPLNPDPGKEPESLGVY